MAITVGPLTPISAALQQRYSFGSITRTNNTGNITPIGLSRDRNWHFGASGNDLRYSADDGATWALVNTFPYRVDGVTELDDGECLVFCYASAATPSYVFRSTGWSSNKLTATWAQTMTTPGGIRGDWTAGPQAAVGSDVIFSEYGAGTVLGDSTTNSTKSRRVHRSNDGGKAGTWVQILDILTDPALGVVAPNQAGVHVHCARLDPYSPTKRVYVSYGDATGNGEDLFGITCMQLMYMDNFDGVWRGVPLPTNWPVSSSTKDNRMLQVTDIFFTKYGIVLMPDSPPYAVGVIARDGNTLGSFRAGPLFTASVDATFIIGYSIRQAYSSAANNPHPIFAAAQATSTAATSTVGANFTHGRIAASHDGGTNWYEIWAEDQDGVWNTIPNCYGPSLRGKCLWSSGYNNGGAWANGCLINATLNAPA